MKYIQEHKERPLGEETGGPGKCPAQYPEWPLWKQLLMGNWSCIPSRDSELEGKYHILEKKMNQSIDHSRSLTMRKINRKWLMVDSRSRKGIKKQRENGDYYQQRSQPLVLTGVLEYYRWWKINDSGEGSMYSGMRPRVGDGETDWKDDVRSSSAR